MVEIKKMAQLSEEEINEQVNAYKEVKTKENANEVMHTWNTWFGKELIETDVLTKKVMDVMPTYSTFMEKLSAGFHWNNMGVSVKVPVLGWVDYAMWYDERTSVALANWQAVDKMKTDSVTITQKPIFSSIDISRQELLYSIVDLEKIVIERLAKSFIKTIESAVLNWDITDNATWNVNCDDAQPSATFAKWAYDHRLFVNNWLRKTVLDWTVDVDWKVIGWPSWANLIQTRSLLWDNSYDLSNLLLIFNGATYNKYITIPEFADLSRNGNFSTIIDWKFGKVSWVDMSIASTFPLTEDDWKVSSTNPNTKWGFIYTTKDAVQRGFGMPVTMEITKSLVWWAHIVAAMEFWFTVVQKKAGETSPRVVAWINVTL